MLFCELCWTECVWVNSACFTSRQQVAGAVGSIPTRDAFSCQQRTRTDSRRSDQAKTVELDTHRHTDTDTHVEQTGRQAGRLFMLLLHAWYASVA